MRAPPNEAVDSMAPASCGLKPIRIIIGMVMVPVVATFETVLPESIPIRALEMIATLAGPPLRFPATAKAKSVKKRSAPETLRKAPKARKVKRKVAMMPVMKLNRPSLSMYRCSMRKGKLVPLCWRTPGQ